MIVSSFLWLTYGFLIQEPAVWQTNMAGLCLSVYYFLRFIKYAPSKALTLPGSIQQHVNVISYIFCLTVSIVYIWPISNPTSVVGNFAVAFCVAMFASPLSALKTVMKTKSAKTIPLPFTVATVINCLLWSVVGIFDLNDFNIYFPNLLGLSCGKP
jgi:solute carrier family 50 protein (sugar transporter)